MPRGAPLEPGDPPAVGGFAVLGRLGSGGQGMVFLGQSPSGQHVAIKLLHDQAAGDPAARARFAREVRAAQQVSPFCTAQVLDFDLDHQPAYVVSEFVDGPSLWEAVQARGVFTGAGLHRLAIGTITALTAIHQAGVIHRDFKPSNVLLASDGPRVVDFGIARTASPRQTSLTGTGAVVGTPAYLAPEQFTGQPPAPAVDVFAWGSTIIYAATGRAPFDVGTLPVIMHRILTEDPDLTAIGPPLRDLIAAALAKDPARRPDARTLLQLVGDAAGGTEPRYLLAEATQLAAPTEPGIPHPPTVTADGRYVPTEPGIRHAPTMSANLRYTPTGPAVPPAGPAVPPTPGAGGGR